MVSKTAEFRRTVRQSEVKGGGGDERRALSPTCGFAGGAGASCCPCPYGFRGVRWWAQSSGSVAGKTAKGREAGDKGKKEKKCNDTTGQPQRARVLGGQMEEHQGTQWRGLRFGLVLGTG